MSETIKHWPDPEIKHEGVHVKLEHRPRKKHKYHLREGSILWCLKYTLIAVGAVVAAWIAYCAVWAAMG